MSETDPQLPVDENSVNGRVSYEIFQNGDLIEINCQSLNENQRIKVAYTLAQLLDPQFYLNYEQTAGILRERQSLRPDDGTYAIHLNPNGVILATPVNRTGDKEFQSYLNEAVEKVIQNIEPEMEMKSDE